MTATWELGSEDGSARIERPPRTRYRAVSPETYTFSERGSNGAGTAGRTLTGFFSVFDRWTLISNLAEGTFMEKIQRGAFAKSIRERGTRLPVMYSHGHDPTLGSQLIGKVRDLYETDEGAYYAVDLFDGLPPLLLEGLRSGAYDASFRAKVVKEKFTERPGRSPHNPDGIPESVVSELALREFGPTSLPAYTDTTADVRSISEEFLPPRPALVREAALKRREPTTAKPGWFLTTDDEPYWLLKTEGAT
jgi:HK97 family phage prohead protease